MTTIGVDTRWFQNRLADKRISQRHLATVLSLDPAAVSLMLRGKRKMSAAEAAEVSRVLNVDVEEVLRRAGIDLGLVAAAKGRGVAGEGVKAIREAPAGVSGATTGEGVAIPVLLSNGGTATLTLPCRLTREDAERISALVLAFAVRG